MLSLSIQTLTIDGHFGAPELSLLEDTTDVVRTVMFSDLGLVYTSVLPLAALWIQNKATYWYNYVKLRHSIGESLITWHSGNLLYIYIYITCKSVSGKTNKYQKVRIIYRRVTILLIINSKETGLLSYFYFKIAVKAVKVMPLNFSP